MLTTIPIVGAVFGLLAGASAVSHIRRILGMETRLPSQPYTVIYGMHPIVAHVLEELCSRDDPVYWWPLSVRAQRPAEAVFIAGDMTDDAVIARSRPDRANRALIACIDEADTMVVAVTLHGIAPEPQDLRADRLAAGRPGAERARRQAHARRRRARRPHRRQEPRDPRGRRPAAAAGRDAGHCGWRRWSSTTR